MALIIGKMGRKTRIVIRHFSLGLLIQDVRGWAILKMVVIQNVNGFAL